MPAKRLTEESVLRLPVKRQAYQVQDSGTDGVRGLHVLVQPSGTRTFRLLYRLHTKRLALVIGRVGDMTLEDARTRAHKARAMAAKGDDPRLDDPERTNTFLEWLETWTDEEQIGRKNCVSAERTLTFMRSSTVAWHNRPMATIQSAEISALLVAKRDGGAKYASTLLYAHFKTLFRWLAKKRVIPSNPMLDVDRPWLGAKGRDLEWFAGTKADDAIRAVWRYAEQIGGDEGRFLKLLLITGKRSNAVQAMRWEHIDDTWYWRPPGGTRSKRNHAIPLPALAREVLGSRVPKGRVLVHQSTHLVIGRVRRRTHIEDFVLHGLRHVVETKLGELRVLPHMRDMLLDHAPARGAGKGYDHHAYRDEMLETLELWCAHIRRVTGQSNARRRLMRHAASAD